MEKLNPISYTLEFGIPAVLGIFALYKAIFIPFTPHFNTVQLPDRILLAVPWFFVAIAIELAASLYTQKKVYRLNDFLSSLYQGTLQLLSIKLFFRSLGLIPYVYIYENYRIVDLEVTPLLWVLTFFLIEWGYYWLHRLAHEINLFWAGHVVHHNSEEYNLSTALRQGIIQPTYGWIFYLPLAFFIPIPLFHFHNQYNTLYQFWIHTQMIHKLPWFLEFIFNTPSHHRVHHGRNPKYLDKNYGGTLIIYDRIFGTFEPEEEDPVYGITHELNTWNPIYIQFHHLIETWEACAKTEGFLQKIFVWLSPSYGPGYNYWTLHPKVEETSENPPEKKNSSESDNTVPPRPKYNQSMPNFAMSFYGFFHSIIIIVLSVIAVAWPFLHFAYALYFVSLCMLGVISISLLFDYPLRNSAKYIELVRLVVYNFTATKLNHEMSSDENIFVWDLVIHGLSLISILWLFVFYDRASEKLKTQ